MICADNGAGDVIKGALEIFDGPSNTSDITSAYALVRGARSVRLVRIAPKMVSGEIRFFERIFWPIQG